MLYFIIIVLFPCFCNASSLPQEITMDEYKSIFTTQNANYLSKNTFINFTKNGFTFKGQFATLGFLPDEDMEVHLRIQRQGKGASSLGIYNVMHDSGVIFSQFILSTQPGFRGMGAPLVQSEADVQREKESLLRAIKRAENSKKEVYGKLLIGDLIPRFLKGTEKQAQDNTPDKREKTKLTIRDGALYDRKDRVFTTEVEKKGQNDTLDFIWVMDKDENIYIEREYGKKSQNPRGNFHSYFIKSKKEEIGGKPIACGGNIKVSKSGKIIFINNQSGHYTPSTDQFLLALHALYEKDVLDKSVDIKDVSNHETYTLETIERMNVDGILAKYPKSRKQPSGAQ
ncbi:MAG: hypothetical protein K2X98_04365 [Alphaproteobacteria bacterium]|nr:hypothetical protein [Alphaproteobacteria bacterium]MBX9977459.1 hypothetical protein [Alphaproteobacteria bacterium]